MIRISILRPWPLLSSSCSWQLAPWQTPSSLLFLPPKTTSGNLCRPCPESRPRLRLCAPRTPLVVLVVALALFGLGPPLSPLPFPSLLPSVLSFAPLWRLLCVPLDRPGLGQQGFRQAVCFEVSRRWSSPPLPSLLKTGATWSSGTPPEPRQVSIATFQTSRRRQALSGQAPSVTAGPLRERLVFTPGGQGRFSLRTNNGSVRARPSLSWPHRALHSEGSRGSCSPGPFGACAVHAGASAPWRFLTSPAYGQRPSQPACCWCRAPMLKVCMALRLLWRCRQQRKTRSAARGSWKERASLCSLWTWTTAPPPTWNLTIRMQAARWSRSTPCTQTGSQTCRLCCSSPVLGVVPWFTNGPPFTRRPKRRAMLTSPPGRCTSRGRGGSGCPGKRHQAEASYHCPVARPVGLTPGGHAEADGTARAANDQAAGSRGSTRQPPRRSSSAYPECSPGPSSAEAFCVSRPKTGPEAAPSVFGPPPRGRPAPNDTPQPGGLPLQPVPEVPAAMMDSEVGAALTQQSNIGPLLERISQEGKAPRGACHPLGSFYGGCGSVGFQEDESYLSSASVVGGPQGHASPFQVHGVCREVWRLSVPAGPWPHPVYAVPDCGPPVVGGGRGDARPDILDAGGCGAGGAGPREMGRGLCAVPLPGPSRPGLYQQGCLSESAPEGLGPFVSGPLGDDSLGLPQGGRRHQGGRRPRAPPPQHPRERARSQRSRRPYEGVRLFNAAKSSTTDRQIADRRGRNWVEGTIAGPSRELPTGVALSCLCLRPAEQTLSICVTDRKDYYHQLMVPPRRSLRNVLVPPVATSKLRDTQAFRDLVSSGARLEHLPESLYLGFKAVLQGDALGVEFACSAHSNLLSQHGLLSQDSRLLGSAPAPVGGPDDLIEGLCIDDYYAISVRDAPRPREGASEGKPNVESAPGGPGSPTTASPSSGLSQAERCFLKAKEVYRREGIYGSDEKDVVGLQVGTCTGAELDSSPLHTVPRPGSTGASEGKAHSVGGDYSRVGAACKDHGPPAP